MMDGWNEKEEDMGIDRRVSGATNKTKAGSVKYQKNLAYLV